MSYNLEIRGWGPANGHNQDKWCLHSAAQLHERGTCMTGKHLWIMTYSICVIILGIQDCLITIEGKFKQSINIYFYSTMKNNTNWLNCFTLPKLQNTNTYWAFSSFSRFQQWLVTHSLLLATLAGWITLCSLNIHFSVVVS